MSALSPLPSCHCLLQTVIVMAMMGQVPLRESPDEPQTHELLTHESSFAAWQPWVHTRTMLLPALIAHSLAASGSNPQSLEGRQQLLSQLSWSMP